MEICLGPPLCTYLKQSLVTGETHFVFGTHFRQTPVTFDPQPSRLKDGNSPTTLLAIGIV